MAMTEKQQRICNKVADEISINLAEWMREKFENADYTIDEMAAIFDSIRETCNDEARR